MNDKRYKDVYDDAVRYVYDTRHSAEDVKKYWIHSLKNYRIHQWRKELKDLAEETGVSFINVCRYIGVEEKMYPNFLKKLPKKRNTFIGIGMAYGLPLETINRWITEYGMKRKLYVKDILDDLIWIYLINANQRDRSAERNYFRMFDSCREDIFDCYCEFWDRDSQNYEDTVGLEAGVNNICFDDYHTSLKRYVRDNMNSFRTAYIKPRRYLNRYVIEILRVKNMANEENRRWTLNSLRGWLDDSMINYLSGSYEHINAFDREKNMTPGFKHIPKNKKAHIAICLALGMSIDAIDEYLLMMGYAPLDVADCNEGQLINLLVRWNETHLEQRKFKDKYFTGTENVRLTRKEELRAINDMLFLREDLKRGHELCDESGRFVYL